MTPLPYHTYPATLTCSLPIPAMPPTMIHVGKYWLIAKEKVIAVFIRH
jgi:hypothetical protein